MPTPTPSTPNPTVFRPTLAQLSALCALADAGVRHPPHSARRTAARRRVWVTLSASVREHLVDVRAVSVATYTLSRDAELVVHVVRQLRAVRAAQRLRRRAASRTVVHSATREMDFENL